MRKYLKNLIQLYSFELFILSFHKNILLPIKKHMKYTVFDTDLTLEPDLGVWQPPVAIGNPDSVSAEFCDFCDENVLIGSCGSVSARSAVTLLSNHL